MNTQNYTPGPWRIHNKHARFNPLILAGPDEVAKSILLAEVRNNDIRLAIGEAQANARLIAAAPQLLKALQKTVRMLSQVRDSEVDELIRRDWTVLDAARADIQAAIGGDLK